MYHLYFVSEIRSPEIPGRVQTGTKSDNSPEFLPVTLPEVCPVDCIVPSCCMSGKKN